MLAPALSSWASLYGTLISILLLLPLLPCHAPQPPSSPSTLAPVPAPTRMPIPFRRALNYFRASPLYCIARWRMAATPFCIASKFITAAAAEIETLPSIVCVCVRANVLSLRVLVCVLTNSHGAQNGNDYISYKSSAIRVPSPRPHAPRAHKCPPNAHCEYTRPF